MTSDGIIDVSVWGPFSEKRYGCRENKQFLRRISLSLSVSQNCVSLLELLLLSDNPIGG